MRSIALFALLLAVFPLSAQPKKHALLIGVNKYQHSKLVPLQYAVNDATELKSLLQRADYKVVLLTNDTDVKPTRDAIDKSIRDLLRQAQKGDTVLMAFAGHGLQFEGDKDSYFCPIDARPFKDETRTLVSMGALYAEMEKSFAGVKILLVDACRDDPDTGRGSRGIDADSAPRPPRGVAAFFSCSASQRAYEHPDLKHGVFFHHVLEGLRGKAKNNDGEVTFNSLVDYVGKCVERDVPKLIGGGAEQQPNQKADLKGRSPVLIKLDASPKAALNASPPAGFTELSNGKDLTGWMATRKTDSWKAEGGSIVSEKSAGFLYTEKEYADFELRLEYKLSKAANSGVAIRAPREGDPAYVGMEIQLIDDEGFPATLADWQKTGSIYNVVPSSKTNNKPVGEWNTLRVICNGLKVTVEVNGTTVLDADLKESREKKGTTHPGLSRSQGHIGLQGAGSRVEFRKVFVKPL